MSAIEQQIEEAIASQLEGAEIAVRNVGGGHFEIDVKATQFEGKRTLERHRLVLGAIKQLMAGDAAPVHAVDKIKTSV